MELSGSFLNKKYIRPPETQAKCEIKIFRLRLTQGHINTLPNLSQLSFCERIRLEVGDKPIQFCIRDQRT
jgi:hypothetical protein